MCMCVCACVRACVRVCVTGFAKRGLQKPSQITQELISNLLLNIKPTLLYYPEAPNTWMAVDDLVYFHRQLFANPVKPPRCTIGFVESMNGINKDVSGVRLLLTTVLTYPVG